MLTGYAVIHFLKFMQQLQKAQVCKIFRQVKVKMSLCLTKYHIMKMYQYNYLFYLVYKVYFLAAKSLKI